MQVQVHVQQVWWSRRSQRDVLSAAGGAVLGRTGELPAVGQPAEPGGNPAGFLTSTCSRLPGLRCW